MKAKATTLLIVILFTGTVRADRVLDNAETLKILEVLTNQPVKAWISSGTISATHEQYRAPQTTNTGEIDEKIDEAIQEHQDEAKNADLSADIQKMKLDVIPFNVRHELLNEYTMNTTERVKTDGSRFHWQITVNSRTDSVKPGAELEGNFMTEHFDLASNRRREFAWNGQEYTLYSETKNSAFVDAGNDLPRSVNGPLTAGIIPWGFGAYTLKNLTALESSAVERQLNGQTQIHLTLDKPDGTRMLFVLDAGNDYAVVSHSTEGLYRTIERQYEGYRSVAGRLVPTAITIEEYDAVTNRLLAGDSWYINSVSSGALSAGEFAVNYKQGAQIEYSSPITVGTSIYRYSPRLDTELLLAERLSFAASQDERTGNCATATLGYAALRLGRRIDKTQLAQLVDGRTGQTSLLAMKEFAHRQGLYCRAVRTDTQTLKGLTDCQIILHIPHKNHFVLVGDIDNESIWTIDLADRKFCYCTDIGFLGMDWTDGTALLVSDRPIEGDLGDIEGVAIRAITGGDGYDCAELLQEYSVTRCDKTMGQCASWYLFYPWRWGCKEAVSGMCIESSMFFLALCPCIIHPYDPYTCIVNGDWQFGFLGACR